MTRASRWTRVLGSRWAGVLAAVVLIAICARPMVIGRTFVGWDWYTHQWFIWHQAESIKAMHIPTLFSQNQFGIFAPHYAFYGGTFYAVAGVLTLITGDPGSAMVIMVVLAYAAGYGGWYWLAHLCGLRGWRAHVPGALFLTAPYYLALIYANGSLPELVAISVIPAMAAASYVLLRADRLRAGPAAILVVCVTLFAGSHNITLLWGGTALLLVGAACAAIVPSLRRSVTRAGIVRVAVVAVPALLVNAWFLLPDVVYQSHTVIGGSERLTKSNMQWAMGLVQPSDLFTLGRATAESDYPHLALQLPILGTAWIVLGLVFLRSAWRTAWYRVVVLLLALITALTIIMMNYSLVQGLPHPYNRLQFSYRIEGYVLLGLAVATIGVLVLLRTASPRRARWAWVLVPIVAWSLIGAIGQLRQVAPLTRPDIRAELDYSTRWIVPGVVDYSTIDVPPLTFDPNFPVVSFPTDGERGKPASVVIVAGPGEIVRTNIITLPQLVDIKGARIVGREVWGQAVLQLDDDVTPDAARVTIQAGHPWPVVLGRVLSLLGIAALAVVAVAIGRGALRRRGG